MFTRGKTRRKTSPTREEPTDELGFRIPIVSGIPDSLSWILDSKVQDSGFHKKKFKEITFRKEQFPEVQNRDYLPWGEVFISWGGSRGGTRGPLIFRPKWGPKGLKKSFGDQPPPSPPHFPFLKGPGWSGSPLSEGLDPPLLFSMIYGINLGFWGNRPPTPPLNQHFALSEK